MNSRLRRAVLVSGITAVCAGAAVVLHGSNVAAEPQITYGLSCMYTRHWLWPPSSASYAYCDPGDGYEEGDWTVEFRHHNVINGWGNWLPVDVYGDVDAITTCSYMDDNVRIWAFASSVVDMEVIDMTEWRIDIRDEYPGNACSDDASAPTMTGLYDSDYGTLAAIPCTSRDLKGQYVVEVYHDSE